MGHGKKPSSIPSYVSRFKKREMATHRGQWPSAARVRRVYAAAKRVKANAEAAGSDAVAQTGRSQQVVFEMRAHQHAKAGFEVHYRNAKTGKELAWAQECKAGGRNFRGSFTLESHNIPLPLKQLQPVSSEPGADIELFTSRKYVVCEYSPGTVSWRNSKQTMGYLNGYYAGERQFVRLTTYRAANDRRETDFWAALKEDRKNRKGKPLGEAEFRAQRVAVLIDSTNDEIIRVGIDGVEYYRKR